MPYSPVISTSSSIVVVTPSTTDVTGGFSITPSLTYNQILQSMGVNVYGSEFLYLYGNNTIQVSQPITYNHFDSNGNAITTILVLHVDPYQSQNAIYYETNPDEIIFDGFSSISFNVLPNSTVLLKVFVLITSNSLFLNDLHDDNFQDLEKIEGVSFFNDFCNYIIDKEDAT